MKKTHYFSFLSSFLLFFLFLSQSSNAQEITDKDSDIVTSKSIEMLQEFKQLLTLLISPDIDEATIKELIANSYAKDDPNAIFFNEKVVFEDDINPNHFDYKTANDFVLRTYLKNIDLFLVKDTASSIVFSDIRASNVKLGEFLYVKVFFKSLFKVNNKEIKMPYRTTERVAEIRAEYENDKWKFYIMRVSFVTPEDLADPYKNDLDIVETARIGAKKMDVSTLLKEKERRKVMEDERKITILFQRSINSGDSALKVRDYTLAIMNYQKAKELQPNERVAELNQKIKDTEILKESERILSEKKKAEDDEKQKTFMALNKKLAELQQQALKESAESPANENVPKTNSNTFLSDSLRILFKAEGDGSENYIYTGISENGKKVVRLTSQKMIGIWEPITGKLTKVINLSKIVGSDTRLIDARLSQDGNILAIYCEQNDSYSSFAIKKMLIYDINSVVNNIPTILLPQSVQLFEISKDNSKIAMYLKELKTVRVSSLQNGDYQDILIGNSVQNLAFSPSGTQIYVTTKKDFQIISAK
jgi:hypothetical protein